MAKKHIYHSRMKQIDDQFHLIKEIVDEDVIKIGIVDNSGDMLTKIVSGVKFQHYKDLTNVL